MLQRKLCVYLSSCFTTLLDRVSNSSYRIRTYENDDQLGLLQTMEEINIDEYKCQELGTRIVTDRTLTPKDRSFRFQTCCRP